MSKEVDAGNQTHDLKKHYFRDNLIELIDNTEGKPIIVRGRYKHREKEHFYTFITVRPIIPGYRTTTICGHINIPIDEADDYIALDSADERTPFIIIGTPSYYGNNIKRGCIKLFKKKGIMPIFKAEDLDQYLTKELFRELYQFDMKYALAKNPRSYPSLQ